MALLDVRCRDVARILVEGPKTRREIGSKLHELYPSLRARGAWVREVLLEKNPLVTRATDDTWSLSDLGEALVRLPGELGKPLTNAETALLLGLLLLDSSQRKVVAELLSTGKSQESKWLVVQTARVLKKMGIFEKTPQMGESQASTV